MAKLFISCTGQSPAFCSNNLRTPYSFGTFSCCSDKVSDKFASLWQNSPISRDKSQICWTNMCLVRFLPNFIGFCGFTWISQLWNFAKFQKPGVAGWKQWLFIFWELWVKNFLLCLLWSLQGKFKSSVCSVVKYFFIIVRIYFTVSAIR